MAEAQVYNASNPKHVKHRKRLEQKWQDRIKDGITYVLADRKGRDLMYWLVDEFGFFKDSAADNDSRTNRNVGMRNAALKIYKHCEEIAPKQWGLTLQEHYDERYQEQLLETAMRVEEQAEREKNGEATQ
jgi:hypothetical protein